MAIQASELVQVGLALGLTTEVKDFESRKAEIFKNDPDGNLGNYQKSRAALKEAILAACDVPPMREEFLAIWFFLDQPDFDGRYWPYDQGISFSREELVKAYPKVWAAFAACGNPRQ